MMTVLAVWSKVADHKAQVDVSDPNYGQTALDAPRARSCGNRFCVARRGAKSQRATRVGETPAFIKPNSWPASASVWAFLRGGVPADTRAARATPGGMTPLLYARAMTRRGCEAPYWQPARTSNAKEPMASGRCCGYLQ